MILDEDKAAELRAKQKARCIGCGCRLPLGKRKWHSRDCRLRTLWQTVKSDPVLHAAEKRRIRTLKRPATALAEDHIDEQLKSMRWMDGYDGPRPTPVNVWPSIMRHAQLFGLSGLSRVFRVKPST